MEKISNDLISKQETLSQLEKMKDDVIEKLKHLSFRQPEEYVGIGEHNRVVTLDDAIEIVKHGFPDKCDISEKCSDSGCAGCVINKAIKTIKQIDRSNSESIRDKAVEWNKYSSKKVPYEFIDFVEGKREISVSEDYCEWRMVDRLNNSTIYNTSCGKTRSPYTSGVDVYCNGCGKKIKVVK